MQDVGRQQIERIVHELQPVEEGEVLVLGLTLPEDSRDRIAVVLLYLAVSVPLRIGVTTRIGLLLRVRLRGCFSF